MKKILFVCLGNICRSPLAEAIFNEKVKKRGLSGQFSSDSAGTANYHVGASPDPRTIEVATNHNIPIQHKGQQFEKRHADEFHYLIAMDHSNLQKMNTEMGNSPESLFLMRYFDPEGKGLDVPDPYYGGKEGFDNMYQILDRSIDELMRFLQKG